MLLAQVRKTELKIVLTKHGEYIIVMHKLSVLNCIVLEEEFNNHEEFYYTTLEQVFYPFPSRILPRLYATMLLTTTQQPFHV